MGPLLCVVLAAVVNFVGDYLMVAVFKTGAARGGMGDDGITVYRPHSDHAFAEKARFVEISAKTKFPRRRGVVSTHPMIPTKAQVAPVMPFFGPITFLVAALVAIYTTQILAANALGVTVSAAHKMRRLSSPSPSSAAIPWYKPAKPSCPNTSSIRSRRTHGRWP